MADDKTPRKAVNLRMDPDLYEELRQYAERTERSINGAVVHAIRQLLTDDGGTVHVRPATDR